MKNRYSQAVDRAQTAVQAVRTAVSASSAETSAAHVALLALRASSQLLDAARFALEAPVNVPIMVREARLTLNDISPPTAPAAPRCEAVDLLMGEVDQLETPDMPFVYIPRLARALAGRLDEDQFRYAVFAAAADGRLELRPESGVRQLSDKDLALALRGPDGTLITYVARTTSP